MSRDQESKQPDPRDVLAGKNLAVLRGEMSQAALAEKMRERGWKWSQATVWSIERGARPLRLAEAVDVVEVLDFPRGVDYAFLREESTAHITRWGHEASRRYGEVRSAIEAFRDAQLELAVAYTQAQEEEVTLTVGDVATADSWLAPDVLEQAVIEADRNWLLRRWTDEPDPEAASVFDAFKGKDTYIWTRGEADDGEHPEEA